MPRITDSGERSPALALSRQSDALCTAFFLGHVRMRIHYAAVRTKFCTVHSISNHASTLWKIVFAVGDPSALVFVAFLCWAALLSSSEEVTFLSFQHFHRIEERNHQVQFLKNEKVEERYSLSFPKFLWPFQMSTNLTCLGCTVGREGSTPSDEPEMGTGIAPPLSPISTWTSYMTTN